MYYPEQNLGDNFPNTYFKCNIYNAECKAENCSQFLDHKNCSQWKKYKPSFEELKEISLSQDPKSKYYKGKPITQNDIDDFKIDLETKGLGDIILKRRK